MNSFKDYYLGTLIHPRRTFEILLRDDRRLRFGTIALVISVVLYLLVYVFLELGGGAPSTFKPWLAIPSEEYYYYNRLLLVPSMIACWILSAGVAQLLCRAFSGRGSFEDMLAVFGFAIGIATLASLLHDLPDSFLGAIGVLDLRQYEVALNSPTIWRTILWICYGLSAVLFLVLYPIAVFVAQRIRTPLAIVIGVFCFAVYQIMFLVFNR